ncbi:MAG: site-specific DNA-methyltransferase [Rikenellaceae bacterium]
MTNRLDGLSLDLEATNKAKLQTLFPECFTEGSLDIDKLLSLCGEYIDNDFEKYKFEWKGKSECLRLAQKRSSGTLRPCREESVDFDTTQNLYIEGDNLEVLKLLQTAYFRRVKMIYIDPPYNTGNDFVYEDDFKDPMTRYKEVTAQTTKSNPETMGRFHTNWLNMMYPRLRLAANLLRDDGVIFISIDDNEVDNLKKLCNEVFGEENFIAQVVWQKRTSPDARRIISAGHEYILIYAKDLERNNPIKQMPLSDADKVAYKNPDNDPRGPWISTDCTAQAGHGTKNQFYVMTTPAGRVVELPDSLCWRYTQDKMNQEIEAGRIWFGKDGQGVPRKKTYLSERTGRNIWTWWPNSEVGHTQSATQELTKILGGKLFDFSKPIELVSRCLSISTSKDDIILDFFSGSATTAHAVMQLNAEDGGNRKFICVQLPEVTDENSEAARANFSNICEIGKERIRRAGILLQEKNEQYHNIADLSDAEQLETVQATLNENGGNLLDALKDVPKVDCRLNIDTGFKVFKLDTSNLREWDSTPIEHENLSLFYQRINQMVDSIKPDRTDMDVVYEVMLKMGMPLDVPVSYMEVNEKIVYVVGDLLLLICMAENLTAEDVTEMASYAPGKIILAEQSFVDDSSLSNAHYILRDKQIELKLV